MNCRGDVRVVERVLASVITANVTLTTETASGTRLIAFHCDRVIVRLVLVNLSSHDWRIRRIVFIGMADIPGSKTDCQIQRQPRVW